MQENKDDTFIMNNTCPYCHYICNSVSPLEGGRRPNAGDYSICINCAKISVFDKSLKIIKYHGYVHKFAKEASDRLLKALENKRKMN